MITRVIKRAFFQKAAPTRYIYFTTNDWFNAFDIEYNPLENYDRIEHWTEKVEDIGQEINASNRSANEVNETSSVEDTTGDNNTTNTVSAYDSSNYEPKEKSENDNSSHTTGVNTSEGTSNESANGQTDNTYNHDLTHDGRISGNIGVLTSQKMLEEQLKIREWNVYTHICDIFKKEMLITIF